MRFRLFNKITETKTNLLTGLALIGLFIVLVFDFNDSKFSFHEILVEFHGLVFDLFVLGILLTIYESISYRKEKIDRYKEEINDYRFWKSNEAMYRIRGLVKRLVDLNIKEIDLSHCYLESDKSFSTYKDMQNWKFSDANLKESLFLMSDLENAKFYLTNLTNAKFNQVNLTNCKFSSAILYNTTFEKCIFKNTDLTEAVVNSYNWFELLDSMANIGIDSLKEKYIIAKEPIIVDDLEFFKIMRK